VWVGEANRLGDEAAAAAAAAEQQKQNDVTSNDARQTPQPAVSTFLATSTPVRFIMYHVVSCDVSLFTY